MNTLAASIQPFIDKSYLAGAVLLAATKDRVLALESVGYADLASKRPMTPDALFWIASMTKPMTGTALTMLIDEGKVGLEDPVEKYLPEFKDQMFIAYKDDTTALLKKPKRPITVREILSHTSGLAFCTPMEAPTFDRYGIENFDPAEAPSIVAHMIPIGSRVLDVGCGMGLPARMFRDVRKADVVGIEPDPGRAAAARSLGLEIHEGFLTKEFLAGTAPFDVINFMDVLEHVPDPATLLQIARSGLKPGGSIIASVPNVAHWTVRWRLLFGNFDYEAAGIMDATHLRWFTAKTIRQLFERNGLAVEEMRATAGTWIPAYSRIPVYRVRRWLVVRLSRWFPKMFGAQHIVRGVLRG